MSTLKTLSPIAQVLTQAPAGDFYARVIANPERIARRAEIRARKARNAKLADALRIARKPRSGGTWVSAQKLMAAGFTAREAAKLVVVVD